MILVINTSKTDLIRIQLVEKGKIIDEAENRQEYQQSEMLLSLIDKVAGKNLKKLKAVAVVSGPGAFSALRFGVTTANVLAWILKLPMVELTAEEAGEKLIESLKKKPEVKIVVPVYGREPNITKTKK